MPVCLETLGHLSVGDSLGAISLLLVDRWDLSPVPSDNDVSAKILPETGVGSHYCLVILFQY